MYMKFVFVAACAFVLAGYTVHREAGMKAKMQMAEEIEPAFGQLIRQALQGGVLHNDGTTIKYLHLMQIRLQNQTPTNIL